MGGRNIPARAKEFCRIGNFGGDGGGRCRYKALIINSFLCCQNLTTFPTTLLFSGLGRKEWPDF